MAVMTTGFMTTLLPRPVGIEPQVWTSWGGTFATEGGATHNGERTWSPNQSYKSFTASTYALAGMEARTLLGTGGAPGNNYIFTFCQGSPSTQVGSLRCDASGNLYLVNGASTQVAVAAGVIAANATYYTVECAWGNEAGANVKVETRINGARIPALTTSNFPSAGGQPAGVLAMFTAAQAGTISLIAVAHANTAQTPNVYWYYQKNHISTLWTTVDTNTIPPITFAQKSDFVGQKKRAWLNPNAAGNYTLAAGNWDDGVGTYPASISDTSAGMDSDTSYIKNIVSGTAVAADKVSHAFTDLPGTATNVGFVQRTLFSRWDQVSISDTIRTGLRNAGVDNMDPDIVVGPGYSTGTGGAGSIYYAQMPYTLASTTVWSATTVNAIEGVLEQRAFT